MAGTLGREVISTRQRKIAELAQREPKLTLTTLAHHVDDVWMREAYRRIRKDAAAGVDGVTAAQYEADLEANLSGLLERFKSGRYRAPAVRRVHLEKPGTSKTRPIGIPTLEDKILQRAVLMVLEPVYEQDFLDCWYGFRPGRGAHQALQSLWEGLMEFGGGWAGQIRSECHVWLAALNHGSAAFVGDLARSGDRMLPPSWRLMAVALGGRGDYGVVWAWPRAPRGRGVGGEAMDAVGRVRSAGRWSRGGVGGEAMDAVGRVRSAGRWSRGGVGGHFQEVEDTARVPGKTAHGLGDSEPARFDDADGEATQPGHVLRAVS